MCRQYSSKKTGMLRGFAFFSSSGKPQGHDSKEKVTSSKLSKKAINSTRSVKVRKNKKERNA